MQHMERWNQLAIHSENIRKMSSTNSIVIQLKSNWWTDPTLSFTSALFEYKCYDLVDVWIEYL